MEFFKNIIKSIYGPEYYQEVIKKPFWYSLKYYILFSLLISVLVASVMFIVVFPNIQLFAKSVPTIAQHFPEKLAVTIQEGKVSTNVEEPYFVAIPKSFKNMNDAQVNGSDFKDHKNLLVINTKESFSAERFLQLDTFAWLTYDSLIIVNGENGISIQPIDPEFNGYIDRSEVTRYVSMVAPYVWLVYPGALLLFFAMMMAVTSWLMIYLLFGALIIWIIAKIKNVPLHYSKAYQVGLHAMTLGIIITRVVQFTEFGAPPFFFTLVLVVMVAFNLKQETPEAVAPVV